MTSKDLNGGSLRVTLWGESGALGATEAIPTYEPGEAYHRTLPMATDGTSTVGSATALIGVYGSGGSAGRIYRQVPTGCTWDVDEIMIAVGDASVAQYGTYGAIASLTNGCTLEITDSSNVQVAASGVNPSGELVIARNLSALASRATDFRQMVIGTNYLFVARFAFAPPLRLTAGQRIAYRANDDLSALDIHGATVSYVQRTA